MLSILIPIHNYDVSQLVNALHQEAEELLIPFEILAYEDGSTEHLNTNKQLQALAHCQYLQRKENIGRSAIRNLLATNAQYNHLLFLDCDGLIAHKGFIKKYLTFCNETCVVVGGTAYDPKDNNPQHSLRLKYGREKETKTPLERDRMGKYTHFSTFNFMIAKSIFEQIKFREIIKEYGHEDTLFGYQLSQHNIKLYNIDNPLIHKGLDSNKVYLQKTETATQNLYQLHQSGAYPFLKKQSALLQAFEKTKQMRLSKLCGLLYRICSPLLHFQLSSTRPSLLLFDLYKLLYLCHIASQKDKMS